MANKKKEFAKFLSGVAVEEIVIHWAFGLSGALPFKFWVFTLTPAFNSVLMIFWPIVAVALIYYAWIKK